MSIPILTIRLLDILMPNEPDTKKLLLTGAKDLIKSHQQKAKKKNIDTQVFHNKDIIYSSIQLDRFQGTPEWTAFGTTAVNALHFWYELFQKENPYLLNNTIIIQENYTPNFLPYQRKYRIAPCLMSDDVAKHLNNINDKYLRYDRLEKYLYGNLQTFFKFIGYSYDKEANFLKINVLDAHPYDRALTVYHNQKKTAFDIKFNCNFRLPQSLRLGQSTALGYGKISHL